MKARKRITGKSKRGRARQGASRSLSSIGSQDKKIALLTRERDEALDQQTATAEILKVIRNSPTDTQPVFDTIAANALNLCGATFSIVLRFDGELLELVSMHNLSDLEGIDALRRVFPRPPRVGGATDRAILTRTIAYIPDVLKDQGYQHQSLAQATSYRSILSVPILQHGEPVGAITVAGASPGAFSERQAGLLKTFADQAVIAIENVRLFDEVQKRTDDLTEALEQQTATSEVLKVISSSPGDLEPVFETMLSNMCRICDARFSGLLLREGDAFQRIALHGAPPAYADLWNRERVIHRGVGTIPDQTVKTKQAIQVVGLKREQSPALFELAGARTLLSVPLIKDDEVVGVISIYRPEMRPFTDKQIELVKNFAAQAVIAIENTRLLNELRQRTDDLSESLEQQTATSEVLKVISSSPGDLEPVFQAMLENATRICEAQFGTMYRYDGSFFNVTAMHNAPPAFEAARRRAPFRPPEGSALATAAATKQVAHIHDIRAAPSFVVDTQYNRDGIKAGYRTIMSVPMLKNNEVIGVMSIFRPVVRPFTDKQIELVQNFAAQAVIAIENTRLLSELRESLQQQTATADVLKVISRSTFDLQTVLDALVESAVRLCGAESAHIFRRTEETYELAACRGYSREYEEFMRHYSLKPGRESIVGRIALEGRVVHIPDVLADPEYSQPKAQSLGRWRTMLGVPLLREGKPVGALTLTRSEVRPFTDNQIELLTTFADQAVIAIENVRLFDEIQDKSRQLAEASQHKSQFLANMSHELRTPLNAILGYTELILDGIYGETPEKAQAVLKRVESNGRHLLGLINDVLDLSKIEAGQLKLTLTDYSIKDVVHGVYSALEPLATKKNLNLRVAVPDNVPGAHGDERKLTQVLLNLVGNAIKFTDQGEVAINVAAENGSLSIAVRDTGPGIALADQARLFEEFQQADNSITKTKGGTGLGLAISKRIIEMHGGQIILESSVGHGSTFKVALPIKVERQVSLS